VLASEQRSERRRKVDSRGDLKGVGTILRVKEVDVGTNKKL